MNKRQKLLFVPSGRLENRLKAIASAYWLHRYAGIHVRVLWFRHTLCQSAFCHLFQPYSEPGFTIEDARPWHYAAYDRPALANAFLPRAVQHFAFGGRIDDWEVEEFQKRNYDFASWAYGAPHSKWMSCDCTFGQPEEGVYGRLFRPSEAVCRIMKQSPAHSTQGTLIGVCPGESHNTLHTFGQALQAEHRADPYALFFLCAAQQADLHTLKDQYGEQLCCCQAPGTDAAAQEMLSLAELLLLTRCKKIYIAHTDDTARLAAAWRPTKMEIISIGNIK